MNGRAPFDLGGRTALVTGAARGLGLAMAQGLAAAGARVILNGRDPDALAEAAASITTNGGDAEVLAFDVADLDLAAREVEGIVQRWGALDILVNNAGQRARGDLFTLDLADARRLLELQLIAPLNLAREAARPMITAGWGRIVNVTSIAGPIARAGDAAYTAAKGGLEALTRALAADLGRHGVTVNAIAPGYFATPANTAMTDDPTVADWLARRTSLGRWGEPHEIAGACVFLASDASAYVTGQVIAVDGGYLAHF